MQPEFVDESAPTPPIRTSRAPQPSAAGLALGAVSSVLLMVVLVSIVLGSQELRRQTCHMLALDLTRYFAPSENQNSSIDQTRATLGSLERALVSFARVEPATADLRQVAYALLGEQPPSYSVEFLTQILEELKREQNFVETLSTESPGLSTLPRSSLAQLLQNLPPSMHESERRAEEARQRADSFAQAVAQLQSTLRSRRELHEQATSFLQRLSLVQSEVEEYFSLTHSDPSPDHGESDKEETLSARLYHSGILTGLPQLAGIPDGIEHPDALKAAIESAGGTIMLSDGASLTEAQAKIATLQSTGISLLAEARELDVELARTLSELREHARTIKSSKFKLLLNGAQVLVDILGVQSLP